MVARTAKKNPHETQAKVSLLLAVVGVLSALALIVCVFWRFDFESFTAYYAGGSLRSYVIIASTVVGIFAGGTGFFVGLNSAGQRRNRLSGLAWLTFFVHSAVITVTLCLFVIFWLAKDRVS